MHLTLTRPAPADAAQEPPRRAEHESPCPREARDRGEAAQPLVSSIQAVAVEFDCRKGSQTGPCSLVAAGVFEPVPEYRTHGHRAGLH